MKISSFKVTNYKSFIDSGVLNFEEGFNVIVGQNNVGKSALLEALSLEFKSCPHRSLSSVPYRGALNNSISSVKFSLAITGGEFQKCLFSVEGQHCFPLKKGQSQLGAEGLKRFFDGIFDDKEIVIKYCKDSNVGSWKLQKIPAFLDYEVGDWVACANVNPGVRKLDSFSCGQGIRDTSENLWGELKKYIYCFRAERMNVGRCQTGIKTILSSNATNLPECLHVLQSRNPARFIVFNNIIREIFPNINEIRVVPVDNSTLEIVVWTEGIESQRDDLAVSLLDSGTGISQVLSIIYVAITSDYPTVIIIDEPNSFLHPGAARKLIEILRRYFDKHQYIISTHSAEIINASKPSSIKLLKYENRKTIIENLDADNLSHLNLCLSEVGARLSDVFGADNILWVEGPTEEECFNQILSDVENMSLIGLSIIPVRNTGDLEGKKANLIWDIYSRISTGGALLPPTIAFVFDRECKTFAEIEDLERKSKGKVKFIPRRMYENYLINVRGIEHVINELPTFKDSNVSESDIFDWILTNGNNKKYISEPVGEFSLDNAEWLANVHAANLLDGLFEELSNSKERYRKMEHSVQLTKWLIENNPEQLLQLKLYLIDIVNVNHMESFEIQALNV